MAFPETNTPKRDPYSNPMRDPTGTNPNSQSNYWNWGLAAVAVALVAYYIFGSSPAMRTVVTTNPTTQSVPAATPIAPVTPAPVAPAPATPVTP